MPSLVPQEPGISRRLACCPQGVSLLLVHSKESGHSCHLVYLSVELSLFFPQVLKLKFWLGRVFSTLTNCWKIHIGLFYFLKYIPMDS